MLKPVQLETSVRRIEVNQDRCRPAVGRGRVY